MPLTGTFHRTLDDKRRVAIPKRMRDDFDPELKSLYLAPGMDGSLVLYSPEGFDDLARRMADKASHRNYLRMFYSQAERLDLDSQGRVRIPDRLGDFASLQKDVVLVGVRDHAEVWDQQRWEQFSIQNAADFDQLAMDVMSDI